MQPRVLCDMTQGDWGLTYFLRVMAGSNFGMAAGRPPLTAGLCQKCPRHQERHGCIEPLRPGWSGVGSHDRSSWRGYS